jgi:hypothetical protein
MKKIIEKMVGYSMSGVAVYILVFSSNFNSTHFWDYEKNILALLMLIVGLLICFSEQVSVEEFYADEKETEDLETEISFMTKKKI